MSTRHVFHGFAVMEVAKVRVEKDPEHHCIDIILCDEKDKHGIARQTRISIWGTDRKYPVLELVTDNSRAALPELEVRNITAEEAHADF